MDQQEQSSPAVARGFLDEVICINDLPSPDSRWVARHKLAVISVISGRLLSKEDVCNKYDLSEEELGSWFAGAAKSGLEGLQQCNLKGDSHRSRTAPSVDCIKMLASVHGLCMDPERRSVVVDGNVVLLPPQEYDTLSLLATNYGIVVTKELILSSLCSIDVVRPHEKIVDVLICKLRRKLKKKSIIKTVWGRGYMIPSR